MRLLNENAVIGLLVALSIGPDLTPTPALSLAVRLGAGALLILAAGRRLAAWLIGARVSNNAEQS